MSTTDQTAGTPEPEPEPEPVEEQWAYGGVRELAGKRVHAWLPEAGTGRELLYTMKGSFVIGEIYRASVTRSPEGRTVLHGSPRYEGDGRLDAEAARVLRAEHHTATTRLSLARMQRSAARRDELDEALAPLRAIAARFTSRADRAAFVAYVVAVLSRPGR
jgi:hypothetical protein